MFTNGLRSASGRKGKCWCQLKVKFTGERKEALGARYERMIKID